MILGYLDLIGLDSGVCEHNRYAGIIWPVKHRQLWPHMIGYEIWDLMALSRRYHACIPYWPVCQLEHLFDSDSIGSDMCSVDGHLTLYLHDIHALHTIYHCLDICGIYDWLFHTELCSPPRGAVVVFVCGQWQVLQDFRRPARVLLEGVVVWVEIYVLFPVYVYVSIYTGACPENMRCLYVIGFDYVWACIMIWD